MFSSKLTLITLYLYSLCSSLLHGHTSKYHAKSETRLIMYLICLFAMTCSNEEKHSTYKTFGIIAGLVLIVSVIIASGALTAAAPAFAAKSGNPNLGQSG
jgi:hypothetical protein